MGTTATIADNTQGPDRSPDEKLALGIDDALLRYWPSFYRCAFRYVGNAADAEDAVQDALLSAHKHLGQFRGQARFSTWLMAIVINSARMQLRKRRRQPQVRLDEHHPDDEGLALSELLPDCSPNPEELYRRSELAEYVLQLARQLSPTLRKTFQLRHLDGLSIRETAHLLGVAEGTVKAQLARTRAKLRALMRKKLRGASA